MIRGVLFDLFGTVVAPFSRVRHNQFLKEASETIGVDPDAAVTTWEADYSRRIRGVSGRIREQLKHIAAAQRITPDRHKLDEVATRYELLCDSLMQPTSTAVATLNTLREHTVPVGLVSNTAPDFAIAFKRSPLRQYFSACTFSCELGVAKPEVAIYTAATGALDLGAAEVLFVGDGSDNELTGARRAGLEAVLVQVNCAHAYDSSREDVNHWTGQRVAQLKDVVSLFFW